MPRMRSRPRGSDMCEPSLKTLCCDSIPEYRTYRYLGVSTTAVGAFAMAHEKYSADFSDGHLGKVDLLSCDDVSFQHYRGRWPWSPETWITTIVITRAIK